MPCSEAEATVEVHGACHVADGQDWDYQGEGDRGHAGRIAAILPFAG
jgi:hypothetical protein